MLFASAMFVATSIPANALMPSAVTSAASQLLAPVSGETQQVTVTASEVPQVERDDFSVTSAAKIYKINNFSFTNNPFGTIQWPFAVGVPVSSTFGWRVAPCSICSTFHSGVDFAPGLNAPIQAIADGVVTTAQNSGTDLGTMVVIEHVIDGQNVRSVYGHMRRGSPTVVVGQHVKVGQVIGLVGDTGVSTGPHLHLSIYVNDVLVNPLTWLKQHAN